MSSVYSSGVGERYSISSYTNWIISGREFLEYLLHTDTDNTSHEK